jgi:hypothetical protein
MVVEALNDAVVNHSNMPLALITLQVQDNQHPSYGGIHATKGKTEALGSMDA